MTYTAENVSLKGRMNSFFIRNRTGIYALLSFCGAIILSAAVHRGDCTSFGAAMVGAMGAGLQGAASLIGCAIGYTVFFGFDCAAGYIASAVVIYTISFVCQYSPIYKSKYFAVVNVSTVLGITFAFDAVSTVRGDFPYYLELIMEIIQGAIMTYVYQASMKSSIYIPKQSGNHKVICFLICISSFIVSCTGFQIVGELSFGRILYFISLLSAVRLMDTTVMILTASIVSLAVSVSGDEMISYLYLSVVYMVICMLFEVKTKKISSFILLTISIFVSFLNDTYFNHTLFEVVSAVGIFSLIPTAWFHTLRLYLEKEEYGQEWFHNTDDSTERIADLLTNISSVLNLANVAPKEIDTMEVFQYAVERVCNGCSKRDICWGNHRSELLGMFIEMNHKVERRGKITIEDFSDWFREYCLESQIILMEINYELRNRADKLFYESSLKEKYDITCDIFHIVSDVANRFSGREMTENAECKIIEKKILGFLDKNSLEYSVSVSMIRNGVLRIELQGNKVNKFLTSFRYLDEMSEVLNMRLRVMKEEAKRDSIVLYKAEPYAVSVGVATKKKKGEQVCGDSYSYFKTEQGVFHVILSDGLGTGKHAREQSSFMIGVMERFIISELQPMEAVQLTNMIVSLNNKEQWDCATIDLFCLDLYTGQADIYKIGAAPSYLYSRNDLHQIAETMLCAGSVISESPCVYHESFLMRTDDVLVIMSDGIVIDQEDKLRETIDREDDSMKILARTILLNSQSNDSSDDDMTVIAVKMEHRL